jgi:putative SOS response-associated peptidase YedK
VLINARAETAHERPMFSKCLETRRCIVPSTGFYEWKHVGGKSGKEKYLIREGGRPVLYMAGLYNRVQDAAGNPYVAYVILTTAANGSIAPLHDRMPVVLHDDEQRMAWLREYGAAREILTTPDTTDFELTAM